jgi:hypothetical protein
MMVVTAIESMRQNVWAYKTVPNNTSLNVNTELLLISGLKSTMWVYVTPNVHVMEIYHAIPREACFINKELLKRGSSQYQRNHWQNF